ncbi:MAG TPA: hypothetical protein VMY59_01060 [Candidatus Thermoplasmatota archaeon]|nr:hypothetical protein [Candidatus Thermoplasmatota archaeon]
MNMESLKEETKKAIKNLNEPIKEYQEYIKKMQTKFKTCPMTQDKCYKHECGIWDDIKGICGLIK